MSRRFGRAMEPVVGVLAVLNAGSAGPLAQSLGTFRWQLQPFCNLVTLNVRQDGAVYTLDGVDDQCGAPQKAGVVGAAFQNPDGTIGISLASATAPGAAPVSLHARVSLSTVSGTWADSAGNAGTFVFTPGGGTGGSPRPVPPNGIRPGSVTANQLAPGAVGAAQIAPGAITAAQIALGAITSAQIAAGAITTSHLANGAITAAKLAPGVVPAPITGSCLPGHYLRGILPSGGLSCAAVSGPPVNTIADDIPDQVGRAASMALRPDGRPVIVHHSLTASLLRLTTCGDRFCGAGTVSQFVGGTTPFGYRPSVAIGADGLPVIAHFDDPAAALRVTRCADPDCSLVPTTVLADDSASREVGRQTSIQVPADGRPVISHHDTTVNRLRVTKCGNAGCSSGNVSTTIDAATISEGGPSLAVGADGFPVIARHSAGNLRVTKCGNEACTAGVVSTTVDDQSFLVGIDPSIAVGVDGRPIIAHRSFDGTSVHTLRLTVCGNAACSAGNVTRVLDDIVGAGLGVSLALGADGTPLVSHIDEGTGDVRVSGCATGDCSAGIATVIVGGPAAPLANTALAIGIDGFPILGFRDQQNNLRIVRCGSPTCR